MVLLVALALLFAAPALAEEPVVPPEGQVTVSLAEYAAMVARLGKAPRAAPAAYAIGQSSLSVTVSESEDRFAATLEARVTIETFEDEWTLVPLLARGAALKSATVDGRPVQLVQGPEGLAWSTNQAGLVTMTLRYSVDARHSQAGFVLPLPVPVAAATDFTMSFPATGVDLAVLPSAELHSEEQDGVTRVTASIPATSSILVTWRAATRLPYAVSRAHYQGELSDDALVWTARFQVEVFGGGRVTLPLMPSGVTLNDIRVDGAPATVLTEDRHFATLLQGRGLHQVAVEFQVPVLESDGPPQARLLIPRIPVSRFDLVLPGQKDVKAAPGANVVTTEAGGQTTATVFVPMTDTLVFTWTEAVPEALRDQVRANASLYHAVHAEEGVLHGRALVVYEITHGATNLLELEIPSDTQVNRITAPAGGVSDWVVAAAEGADRKKITVFLEREVSGEFLLEVAYERLLGADGSAAFAVPLLSADKVHRQRGMVALLSGQELALEPVTEADLTRVGENQLPAFLRNQIALTVAHTYKYIDPTPTLEVEPVVPERRQAIFDAQVDTLISLGEVTMKGAATIEIDVKSGSIVDLELRLPAKLNILGVTGPSLRSHEARELEDGQAIALEFTREMAGQFRIEVTYERIMDSETAEAVVPAVSVAEAEVEHGRIAVEALTAVEVKAAVAEQLSSLDLNELPRQLVLKTTNPILLAYRYVHAKPPFRLVLAITRHREIDVQVAAIEQASYSSLFTRDGLAVTTARLMVRNSRQQFLRLALPAGSQVWSVFVDGKPEKPAYAGENGAGPNGTGSDPAVLIKMINATKGFPVDIVYATPVAAMDHLGTLESHLPRPDMVVTHTRWNVFMPVGPAYVEPDTNMDLIGYGRRVNPARHSEVMARAADAYQAQFGQPLMISVPTQGVLFAFEKLYANQSAEPAEFSLRYVSEDANYVCLALSALGTLLLWLAVVALAGPIRLPRKAIIAAVAGGALLLVACFGYLETNPLPASALALAIALGLAAWWAAGRRRLYRESRTAV